MSFLTTYFIGLGVIIGIMVLLWLVSLAINNASIVDIFWGLGFVISAWLYFLLTPDGFLPRKLLIALIVTIWGLRLSIHVFLRNKGKGEDFRYKKWREENGAIWWWKSLFQVFLLQGGLLWIVSAPLLAAQFSNFTDKLTILDFAGLFVWGVGFFFETTGDLQLARFKMKPENRGKVLNTGVWRYTRHPNYFGDATQWWGFYLIALAAGGWWAIFSPLLMTFLLVFVSGVAMLEKTMKAKPKYADYIQSTSSFIPWFPRKKLTKD